MTRTMDPARCERERLLQLEHQTKARREAHAVAAGVEETVALSLARGAGIEAPTRVRGERERPYRRL